MEIADRSSFRHFFVNSSADLKTVFLDKVLPIPGRTKNGKCRLVSPDFGRSKKNH